MSNRTPLLSRLLRHLLPGACLLCDQALPVEADLDLCAYCRASLPWNDRACPRCALPLPLEMQTPMQMPAGSTDVAVGPCPQCLARPPPFTVALAPLRYEDCARVWISRLKDHLGLVEGRLLGLLMADAAARHYGPHERPDRAGGAARRPDLLIPVPLAPARLARRGHNQALTLALPIGRRLGVPVLRRAVVRRGGGRQRGRSRVQRLEAASALFASRRSWSEPGPCVAIVDDVVTTGATAAALARVLRGAGACEVQLIAAARTPRYRIQGEPANPANPANPAMG